MIPRATYISRILKNVEWTLSQFFRPPRELAIIQHCDPPKPAPASKFSLKDLIGDGFLMAVPKFRRTIEKRWKRKFGSPEYVWKMLVPKTNIIICNDCGHHHERGRLCEKCYKRVETETQAIKDKIAEKLGNRKPIENDVIVLYDGEHPPEKPSEYWKGKRIIEMEKPRPQWFSKNLLQKSTQQPSNSTDVKPTDLA